MLEFCPRRFGIGACDVQLAEKHVAAVTHEVVDLLLALALDQVLARLRVALAQHVDHKVAEDEVANQRRDAEVETGIAV